MCVEQNLQPIVRTTDWGVQLKRCSIFVILIGIGSIPGFAEDWPRFLGPMGRAQSADTNVPLLWNDDQNLKWKTALPGSGSSSPIVVGDRIFLTCYTGESLPEQRQLVCVNRSDGQIVWQAAVAVSNPEDPYQGYIREHGYASNTPVSDGNHVFAFFGKSGVVAFDFNGQQLWHVRVGSESSNRQWGSAASLVLYKDLVIVNASEESQSIRALDKSTGEEKWKAEARSLELAYGTPTLVQLSSGKTELVIGVPGEVWGIDPDTGKLLWFAETRLTGNICPSVVVGDQDTVYVFGGYRSSGSHAIRAGGRGDVTQSHMLWTSRNSSYVATPLLYENHLYWVDDRGLAYCAEAATGNLVYRERLRDVESGGRPFYASPVLVGDRWVILSRRSGAFVFSAEPSFKQLAQNKLLEDLSDFNGTPAISDNELFLRSNECLYCISSNQ